MTRVRLHRLLFASSIVACMLAGTPARAALYTLDAATFSERFELSSRFDDPVERFELPFEQTTHAAAPEHGQSTGYLALALRSAPTARSQAEEGESNLVSPISFALTPPTLAPTNVRAQAANASNLGTYQGNLWTLMTANLNGPSGNSLFGFAEANFSEIPFEAPGSVPLPNGAWLFATGLAVLVTWRVRQSRTQA